MVALDDEQSWVVKSQQGDHEAFEALITRYQRMIHSLAYRMSGSLSEAEDLAQEVFLQAHRQLGTFRQEARFSSWLYRIAVNTCLNWRKRDQRREQAYRGWADAMESNRSPAVEPDAGQELARRVQEALLKLHPKQRAAVVLTVYDGLSHAEAARVLGCSETTVSWRVFAARAKLKRWLKGLAAGRGGTS